MEIYGRHSCSGNVEGTMDFKVGDKVVRNYRYDLGFVSIGTIIKITPKRNDIVVDYGHYQETYNKDGYTR